MKKMILIVMAVFSLAITAIYYPWQQTKQNEFVTDNDATSQLDDFLKPHGDNDNTELTIKYPVTGAPEVVVDTNSDTKLMPEPEQFSMEKNIVPRVSVKATEEQLPKLDESDDAISAAIGQLADVTELFLFESFVRHFVVTIDNMTNQKLPQRYIFNQRVPEKFLVMVQEDKVLLDSKNFNRYTNFVSLTERIDSGRLVAFYVKFYPLFQEAYEELGYPDRYFNDRFIQVIDHLLVAPEIKEQIYLIRPKVFYQFEDPELEALSVGQKILVRIGIDNAQRIKSKLRELRATLTTLPAQ